MSVQTNQSLSVDCAVFGFNGKTLKVLLIERRYYKPDTHLDPLKLPGAMILENETLPEAAYRVLEEATGLKNVYLKQMDIFSDPKRVSGQELEWINRYHGINTTRVVTVGYYALVKLDNRMVAYTTAKGAHWVDVDDIQRLAMDHKQILTSALSVLCREMLQSPVAFELLPRKFTIRALQNLYSAVLGIEIDNRNFRKKILSSGFLTPTAEKEQGVAHYSLFIFSGTLFCQLLLYISYLQMFYLIGILTKFHCFRNYWYYLVLYFRIYFVPLYQ